MKVNEITVVVDMRLNLGNYEGFSSPLTLKASLSEGDILDESIKELYKIAKKEWSKEALKQLQFYKARRSREALDEAFDKTKELLKNYANE